MTHQQELDFETPLARAPMVRKTDLATSSGAAAVVVPQLGKIQRMVLEAFREHGEMTDLTLERLPKFVDYGASTVRKRRSELYHAGYLEQRGVDRSGRAPATVWGVVEDA